MFKSNGNLDIWVHTGLQQRKKIFIGGIKRDSNIRHKSLIAGRQLAILRKMT